MLQCKVTDPEGETYRKGNYNKNETEWNHMQIPALKLNGRGQGDNAAQNKSLHI